MLTDGCCCRYMVTHLMGADLNNIVKTQRLSDDHVQFLVYQILRGLKVGGFVCSTSHISSSTGAAINNYYAFFKFHYLVTRRAKQVMNWVSEGGRGEGEDQERTGQRPSVKTKSDMEGCSRRDERQGCMEEMRCPMYRFAREGHGSKVRSGYNGVKRL